MIDSDIAWNLLCWRKSGADSYKKSGLFGSNLSFFRFPPEKDRRSSPSARGGSAPAGGKNGAGIRTRVGVDPRKGHEQFDDDL